MSSQKGNVPTKIKVYHPIICSFHLQQSECYDLISLTNWSGILEICRSCIYQLM